MKPEQTSLLYVISIMLLTVHKPQQILKCVGATDQ